jgi:hypothetical protein
MRLHVIAKASQDTSHSFTISDSSTFYKLAPELRRSAIYVAAACLLIPITRWFTRELVPPANGYGDWVAMGFILAVIVLGAMVVFQWRIRVDAEGIARRRLFQWTLYSWSEFASGCVKASDGFGSFAFPERKPWDRKLSIGLIGSENAEHVAAIIRRHWIPPALDLPTRLAIRYGFRGHAQFGPEALTIRTKGEPKRYLWSHVKELRINRFSRDDFDFTSLELELPDQTLKLHVSRDQTHPIPSWQGEKGCATPGADLLVGVLQKYVAGNRIVVVARREPPQSRREWECRSKHIEGGRKDLRLLGWILIGFWLLGAMAPFMEWERGLLAVLSMELLWAVMWGLFWLVYLCIARDLREQVAEHEARKPAA